MNAKIKQLNRELDEVEWHIRAWAAYKLDVEHYNPLLPRAQDYSEFVGRSDLAKGPIVPVYALDAANHSAPLVESVLRSMPWKMARAAEIYYLNEAIMTKSERLEHWKANTGGNRHQYEMYVEAVKWAIWGIINPKNINR